MFLASLGAPAISHRFIAQDRGHAVIVAADGTVEWETPCPFVAHDIAMLPNGNVLLHTAADTVIETTRDHRTVWQYTAHPKPPYTGPVEIHAFQRLKDGLTMVAESGNRRIVEVDNAGTIVHETALEVDHPDSHHDVRRARKLDN